MADNFKKYTSIENSYREKEIERIQLAGYANIKYAISEKVHGCFHANTGVILEDGTSMDIRDIVNTKYSGNVLGIDDEGNIVPTKVVNWYNNGKKNNWLDVKVRVRQKGYTIRCTPDHKFFDGKEYKPISEFNKGDKVEYVKNYLKPTYVQEQVMIGKMLGDGNFSLNSIRFGHKVDHEEYLNYTMACLGDFAGNFQKDAISGYGTYIKVGRTISCPYIEDVFKSWAGGNIPELKLTPISMAFWYMDDGSLAHTDKQEDRVSIATCSITYEGCQNLVKALAQHGIEATHYNTDGYNRLRINKDSAEIFFTLIAPYIPKCMQYKLPERHRTGNDPIYLTSHSTNFPNKFMVPIVDIIEVTKKHEAFDIETETHNYLVRGIHVHNCNTQLSYDGTTHRVGKRTTFLEQDEQFYNLQKTMLDYAPSLKYIFDEFSAKREGLQQVILFGEGFGGSYPHESVERDKNASKVQKGVFYHPSNKFLAFDLAFQFDGVDRLIYATPEQFEKIMVDSLIPYIPFKVVNSLEEALDYPNDEPSEIYKLYNLPELPNNIREGVVIKPYDVDAWMGQSRVILKNKNEIFAEKSHEKPHVKQPQELPENLVTIINEALTYVNENRVEAVISKLGKITIKDIGKVIGLTNKDVIEDFLKDSGALNTLEKSDIKIVTKQINNVVSKVVKEYIIRNY